MEILPAITFFAGLLTGGVVGALGSVAAFRSSVAVLQVQFSNMSSSFGELKAEVEVIARDVNAIAAKARISLSEKA